MRTIKSIADLLSLHRDDFLEEAYQATLARAPDQNGRRHYLGELARGRGRIWVLYMLWSSNEAKELRAFSAATPCSDSDFLFFAYRRFLRRLPDAHGLQVHLSALSNGLSRDLLLRSITKSQEAQLIQPSYDALVSELSALPRPPNLLLRVLRRALGLHAQDLRIGQLEWQIDKLLHTLSTAPPISQSQQGELAFRLTAGDVVDAYRAVLGRPPESADIISEHIAHHRTPATLYRDLVASEEFKSLHIPKASSNTPPPPITFTSDSAEEVILSTARLREANVTII